jgi:hypothetical protein
MEPVITERVSGDRFVQHEIIINVGCDASALTAPAAT